MTDILFTVVRKVQDNGAWGMLFFNESSPAPICCTLERTYEGAEVRKRIKIPDGVWYCTRRRHKNLYEAWEIHIPGHTYIDIHIGNEEMEFDGCLGLGETFTDFDPAPGIQRPAIGSSSLAFDEFMRLTNGYDGFFIEFKTVE